MRLIDADLLKKEFITNTPQGCGTVGIRYVDKLIEKQPTVKNDEWHVVADGDLPKEFEYVFVASKQGGRTIAHRMPNQEQPWYDLHSTVVLDVVAWRELPEPYIPKEYKEDTERNCLNCRVTKEDLSQEICNKCVDYSKWI